MALRIYWRAARRRCVAELVIAASLTAPSLALAKDEPAPRVTAREAMERQFAAPPTAARPAMSAAEAAAIMKKYQARIGQMIEPRRDVGGDRLGR